MISQFSREKSIIYNTESSPARPVSFSIIDNISLIQVGQLDAYTGWVLVDLLCWVLGDHHYYNTSSQIFVQLT